MDLADLKKQMQSKAIIHVNNKKTKLQISNLN